MNRLTGDFKGVSMFATFEQAMQYNRLAQYENTGLTPYEIAALRAENERLRAGLDTMRELLEGVTEKTVSMPGNVWYAATGALRIARAALEGGQHGTDQA